MPQCGLALLAGCVWTARMQPCEERHLATTEMVSYGTNTDPTLPSLGIDAVYITAYSPLEGRRARMQRRMDRLGLQAQFVTGWDQEQLTDKVVGCMYPSNALFARTARDMNFKLTWMRLGEVSLNMKHAAAYYDAFRRKARHILVFEDDAFISDGFTAAVAELLAPGGGARALPADYQLCFLCNYLPATQAELAQPVRLHHIPPGERQMHGACGYLVSQAGVRWLLDHMPYLGPADLQIAHWDFPSAGAKRYTREPWPAWPDKLGAQQTQKQSPRYARTPDLLPCWGKACPSPSFTHNVSAHIMVAERNRGRVPQLRGPRPALSSTRRRGAWGKPGSAVG